MESDRYGTRDIGLAAYLLAVGRPIVFCEGLPGKVVFYFEGVRPGDVTGFLSGAPAPARALLNALRDLKALHGAGAAGAAQ